MHIDLINSNKAIYLFNEPIGAYRYESFIC
jgi:hypothetical protein